MTLSNFKQLCEEWKDSDEDFAKIVESACTILGMHRRDLAIEFEVAESTVSRWANGVTCPLPRMQKLIVNYIGKRVGRVIKGQSGGSSSPGGYGEPMSASSR